MRETVLAVDAGSVETQEKKTCGGPGSKSAVKGRFSREKIAALCVAGAFTLLVLVGPWLAPYDPLAVDLSNTLANPSSSHLLGTDQLGRDTFSRLLAGGQRTVGISLVALVCSMLIGVLVGMLAGLRGKGTDWVIMRLADSFLAFPEYVVAIVITGMLGPGYLNLLVAIVAVKWVIFARLVRAIVIEQRNRQYVTVAQIAGASNWHIMKTHILPHLVQPLLALATMDLGKIVLLVASLSFLGLGVPQPAPEWGFMLNEGRAYFQETSVLMIGPGIAIFMFVMITGVVGNVVFGKPTKKTGVEPALEVA